MASRNPQLAPFLLLFFQIQKVRNCLDDEAIELNGALFSLHFVNSIRKKQKVVAVVECQKF